MKMSFYEDKTAEILSENKNVKCFIISTALHKNQKNIIKKKINKVNYFSLPNNEPEVFNIKFSDLINKLVQDDKKNFIIFNQFYKIGKKLNDYSKASFFYSLHCPFSANFSNKFNLIFRTIHNLKNLIMLTKKYIRELKAINQIKIRKNSSIIYSSEFVKNYYTNNKLFYMYKKTLRDKSNLIPLCIKKKEKRKFKYKNLEKKLKNYTLKISFIGRVCTSKGIDHILNISRKLNKNPKIIFFIGGATDSADKEKIFKFKKKYNLKNLILNLKGIPNEEVRSLYSLFDISLHFSNVPEGTSYSIMESMISNCIPMSNYSSEMIKKEHGYVFNKINYEEIIFTIKKLINNKNLTKMKKNSSKSIKLNYNENNLKNNFKEKLSI